LGGDCYDYSGRSVRVTGSHIFAIVLRTTLHCFSLQPTCDFCIKINTCKTIVNICKPSTLYLTLCPETRREFSLWTSDRPNLKALRENRHNKICCSIITAVVAHTPRTTYCSRSAKVTIIRLERINCQLSTCKYITHLVRMH
jgi:hypothetical protein